MTKVVYNDDFGGFGLNKKGMELYQELSGNYDIRDWEISRDDPFLVQVVETLGKEVSPLAIRELPKGTVYRIHEYDGAESVLTFDAHAWFIA